MANSDKNIKITPNISASGQPNIVYTGSGNVPIALKVLDDSYGTLSFEGSAGQLFSLNNNLSSGTIFSVNDISGMPQFDVNADGTIRVAPYGSGVYMGGVGGGTFTIQPSAKSSSGAGTSVAITAGNGVTSGAGGSLILQAGIQATTGGDGKVVVKQVAGQTSNLQEWQNSSGSALASLDTTGRMTVPYLNAIGGTYSASSPALVLATGTGFYYSNPYIYFCSGNNSGVQLNPAGGQLIVNVNGQPGSTSGQVLVRPGNGGGAQVNCIVVQSNPNQGSYLMYTVTGHGAMTIAPDVPSVSCVTLNGSAAYTLTATNKSLTANVATITVSGGTPRIDVGDTVVVALSPADAVFDGTYTISAKSGNNLSYARTNTNVASTATAGTVSSTATTTLQNINIGVPGAKGLVIKAAASQTANLQEWQNSSGTALSYINASGILFDNAINSVPVASGAGNNLTLTAGSGVTSGAGGSLILQAGVQATTGGDGKVIVKQASGQTSNLQEWQNSSSTTRAYIILSGNSSKMELGQSASGGTTDKNGITLDSSPNGTGKPTIRLFSSGEVDAQITTSTASFSFNVGASFSGSVSSTGGLSGTSCTAQSSTTPLFRIWKTGSHFFDFDSSVANTLNIKNTSGNTITQWKEGTASVKLTVIGQSGQTANLQEWQNSSSGILTSIGPSGGINLLPYGTSSGNTNEIRFLELAANGAHYVGFKAADTIPSNTTWILPSGDGATGQALITNGSGLLSWGSISNLSSYTNTSAGTTSAYDLGTSNFVKANPSTSGLTINGFSSSGSYDGRMLKLVNVSNYNINIINTGTTVCVGGNNIVLGPKDGADLILDSGASVWRVF